MRRTERAPRIFTYIHSPLYLTQPLMRLFSTLLSYGSKRGPGIARNKISPPTLASKPERVTNERRVSQVKDTNAPQFVR
ncbi:uncharacterized protein G2W53_011557 [Senna tora]|uniref:Uncharacterized protein n=1 Tax=Senna tora TaxID=362788 RepID=A0A834X361_9FABA|nr:uncharacterized protein G2W53_011557 [Senna tora]